MRGKGAGGGDSASASAKKLTASSSSVGAEESRQVLASPRKEGEVKRLCPHCNHKWFDKYGKDECPKCLKKVNMKMKGAFSVDIDSDSEVDIHDVENL